MPVCSYLVIPERGALREVAGRLESLPGCDVASARKGEVLLLVTDTPGPDEDRELRERLEATEGIEALVLAFGEIDPDTHQGDPVAEGAGARRRLLPVVDPGGLGSVAISSADPGDPGSPADPGDDAEDPAHPAEPGGPENP